MKMNVISVYHLVSYVIQRHNVLNAYKILQLFSKITNVRAKMDISLMAHFVKVKFN